MVLHSRQASFLLRDCNSVWRSLLLQENSTAFSSSSSHANITMTGTTVVRSETVTLTTLVPSSSSSRHSTQAKTLMDFEWEMIDPTDFTLAQERVRGGGGGGMRREDDGMLEIFLGDAMGQLELEQQAKTMSRREDITLPTPPVMMDFADNDGNVNASNHGQGDGGDLLAGFGDDFNLDGINMDINDFGEAVQQQQQPPPSEDDFLSRFNFEDDDNKTAAKKRGRAVIIDRLESIRLPADKMRKLLEDNRGWCCDRPIRQVTVTESGPFAPWIFGLDHVNLELQTMFETIWMEERTGPLEELSDEHRRALALEDEDEDVHSGLPRPGNMSSASVEHARGGADDELAVEMDLGAWDDVNHEASGGMTNISSKNIHRASDARLSSISPGMPGRRSSLFASSHSGDRSSPRAVEDDFILAMESNDDRVSASHHGGIMVDDSNNNNNNNSETDIRTYKLKTLMRAQFERGDSISFNHFTSGVKSRYAVANTFLHILMMATNGMLRCEQPMAYQDIEITKTEVF